jgi:type II secretory pathway component PulM
VALQYLLVLVVLAVALYVISGPLLSARRASAIASDDVRALEAARDSKLQEIRDAEMDLRTGKLSDDDYDAIDRALRGEAVQILDRLDAAIEHERVVREAETESVDSGPGPGDPPSRSGADDRLPSAP